MQLIKTFDCTRFMYNKLLNDAQEHYKATGKFKINSPAKYKQEFPWLREVDSGALKYAMIHVKQAFTKFFTLDGFNSPKFKSKKDNYFSYTSYNNNGSGIRLQAGRLRLPKTPGLLRIKLSKLPTGRIINCTISKVPSGKYYVSMLIEAETTKLPTLANKIGIDVGIKYFAIFSDGTKIANPRFLTKATKKLAQRHRELCRKKLGSNNRYKARLKLAKAYERMRNQKNDFLQKLTTAIIRENQSIAIENLRIQNMMQNRNLAKAITEVGWYEFRRMLEYKAEWYGRIVVVAPSNYASSQLCSVCNFKNSAVKELKLREWTCPECGSLHDRDVNAARNLERLIV